MINGSPSNTAIHSDGSGSMFNQIAERYDVMNRLISFGLDKSWRRLLLAELGALKSGDQVLDVATGTADVALAICDHAPGVHVTGLDPSEGMLGVGRRKVLEARRSEEVDLVLGDARNMPFKDSRFAASCISFGIRNVPDRRQGLSEMVRTTRPGGKVVVLELSEPRKGLLAPLARFHIHHVVPNLGAILSGAAEYRYLQKSIEAFPPPEQFGEMMASCGLTNIKVQKLTLGTAHLYTGTVAPAS